MPHVGRKHTPGWHSTSYRVLFQLIEEARRDEEDTQQAEHQLGSGLHHGPLQVPPHDVLHAEHTQDTQDPAGTSKPGFQHSGDNNQGLTDTSTCPTDCRRSRLCAVMAGRGRTKAAGCADKHARLLPSNPLSL